ncbi:MAG: cation transporter [Flavobacteriales bacterium]|nr:cation transporter [Flavobacteriales bacterium]MCB9192199.1 cation transporter [Flavobacteriales bacterium]MCB9205644.1 cation transporter [Flavobacteriales bacterium]
MEDKKYIRFQWFAVSAGVIILVIKFLAFHITGSNAILSDALESIINVVAGSFALYSLILAAKPKDTDHPYGHGKIEFISSGIEGTLILLAGISIVLKSVHDLILPHQVVKLDLGLYLAAGAGLINYILGWITEYYGKKNNSPTMAASGKHLKSDGYTSLGLIIGLSVVLLTGFIWIDSVIAIGFGAYIGIVGLKEVRKSVAGIMDEADFELLRDLVTHLNKKRNQNWIDIHNFRAQKFGKGIHIDCHITVPYYLTVEQAHEEIDAMENLVKEHYPHGVEMFIHTDPCTPNSCRICSKSNCDARQSELQERIEWNLENVLQNQKHQ